jgi:hypothetical protein
MRHRLDSNKLGEDGAWHVQAGLAHCPRLTRVSYVWRMELCGACLGGWVEGTVRAALHR